MERLAGGTRHGNFLPAPSRTDVAMLTADAAATAAETAAAAAAAAAAGGAGTGAGAGAGAVVIWYITGSLIGTIMGAGCTVVTVISRGAGTSIGTGFCTGTRILAGTSRIAARAGTISAGTGTGADTVTTPVDSSWSSDDAGGVAGSLSPPEGAMRRKPPAEGALPPPRL